MKDPNIGTGCKCLNLACISVLLLAGFCFSQPAVKLSISSGPPTTEIFVSGRQFPPNVAVDVYFDTTDLALAVTGNTGSFSQIAIHVPASAQPGSHTVTAVVRSGDEAAQKAFLVRTNWAQFRFGNAHKGLNPYENVLSPMTVGTMDLLWRFSTGYYVDASPAVAAGVVYVGSSYGTFYALNANTGTKLWTFLTGGWPSDPAVANGVVYFSSVDSNVYALNAITGAKLWSFTAGEATSPTVVDNVVYVGAGLSFYALNAITGAKLWSFTPLDGVNTTTAVVNNVVYVGSGHSLYALNARTGAKLWSFTLIDYVCSSPAVANGLVYFGSCDTNVYALNARTGAKVWSFATREVVFVSSPAVANGVVYIGSSDDTLYALKGDTGAELWRFSTLGAATSPAVANGVVYVAETDGKVYALNADSGESLWSFTTGAPIYSSPAVADGVVYVGSRDHSVYAFAQVNGSHALNVLRPPDVKSLQPDLSLKVSKPTAIRPSKGTDDASR